MDRLPLSFTESCRFPQHEVILFVCFSVMTAGKRSNKNKARQRKIDAVAAIVETSLSGIPRQSYMSEVQRVFRKFLRDQKHVEVAQSPAAQAFNIEQVISRIASMLLSLPIPLMRAARSPIPDRSNPRSRLSRNRRRLPRPRNASTSPGSSSRRS